ncbi:hypothetical protein Hanom_Chr13g01226581 [Helianthus anomalus]
MLYVIIHDLHYSVSLITFLVLVTSFFSIFFNLVCWYAIRFGVEGLPRSSLSIPRDRGKELGVSLEAASLSPGIEVRLAYIPPSPDPIYSQRGYRWDYTGYGCCCCCC